MSEIASEQAPMPGFMPETKVQNVEVNLNLYKNDESEKPMQSVGSLRSYHESDPGMVLKEAHRRTSGLFGFSNVEAIKERVKNESLSKEHKPYDVRDEYWETGVFQAIARHDAFQNITLGVIVLNAFWISIDTDGNTADTINDAKAGYIVADCLFFSYFVFELVVRFCAFEVKSHCLCDGWFVFDSALVLLYAFDPFALGLVVAIKGGGGLSLPTAVLRLFRLARLSRLVRMLRSLPELLIMIKGMLSAAASVGYTLALLLVITYVFSIAFRNLVPDGTKWDPPDQSIEVRFFKSVPETIHNLMIYAVFLDNLSDFILNIKEQSTPCLILAWMYIALAALTVLNMLIGVLCEVISAVACEEKEIMMIEKVKEKFGKIASELDANEDKKLTWDEFKVIATNQEALRALESLDVDPVVLIDVAEDFFHDEDKRVFVPFEEFMELVLDLRSDQPARIKDILSVGKCSTGKFISAKQKLDSIASKVGCVSSKLDKMLAKRGKKNMS